MAMNRNWLGTVTVALVLAVASTGHAQQPVDQEPLRIVRQIYAPYITNRLAAGTGQLDLIRPHATPELQRLIDRENACTRRSRGYCALDYDMIIDGQDWKVTGLQVTAIDARPGAMTARASFRNFNRATVVDFSFAMTAGAWKLTDLVIRDGNRRMSTILRTNR
jgi:hypothetical protein